jgi:hypothetical protein
MSVTSLSRREFVAGSLGALALPNLLEASIAIGQTERQPAGELHYLTIRDAAARIKSRQLSPVELTQAILKRIDRVEPEVHAFITLTREAALDAARSAESEIVAGRYRGPLHGIPFRRSMRRWWPASRTREPS